MGSVGRSEPNGVFQIRGSERDGEGHGQDRRTVDGMSSAGGRILAVDDEPRNLRILEAQLLPMGYEVHTLEDGGKAVDRALEVDPDLILLDIMMPGADGYSVLRDLKSTEGVKDVPVLMVTALNDRESRIRALDLGADDFLSKPVDGAELKARVRSHLRVKAYQDRLKEHQKDLERQVMEKTVELRMYSNHLEVLIGTTHQINTVLEMSVILRTLVTAAAKLVDADGGFAGLHEDGSITLTEYLKGDSFSRIDISSGVDCPVLGKLIRTQAPVIVSELNRDQDSPTGLCGRLDIQNAVAVPVLDLKQDLVGSLVVFNSRDWTPFHQRDVEVLQGLASSAATAVENARMMERLRVNEERLSESLREKDILLKEMHHRVKNNLQAISSLFEAQMICLEEGKSAEVFRQGQGFIQAMAFVHEQLYRFEGSERIDLSTYVSRLTEGQLDFSSDKRERITLDLDVGDIDIHMDTAIPLGLIIHELVSNSLKHGFPDGREGRVTVAIRENGSGIYTLVVADDGVGFDGMGEADSPSTFGLQIVRSLVDSLGANLSVKMDNGVHYSLVFREYRECDRVEL